MSVIELNNIRHRYGDRIVLDMPSFQLGAGEECLILGSSGSGKTTLLHILAGILKPSEGEVKIGGTNLNGMKGTALDRFRGQNIGIVLQKLHLISPISVLQNLLLAQSLSGRPSNKSLAMKLLEDLGIASLSKI